ncbi:MAG TPA: tetratricopeptide repeat protein, partial [Nitrospiria bacterium]|nr:tetratricopeptide repeat protein [Nitrospiria bacterium]
MAHFNLGVAYAHEGRDDLSLEAFEKAVSIKPDLAIGHFNIGQIYYNRGELDQSIAAFEKAVEANPKMAAAYYGLAIVEEEAGRKARAVKHYQEFLKLAGDQPSAETEQAAEHLKALMETFF